MAVTVADLHAARDAALDALFRMNGVCNAARLTPQLPPTPAATPPALVREIERLEGVAGRPPAALAPPLLPLPEPISRCQEALCGDAPFSHAGVTASSAHVLVAVLAARVCTRVLQSLVEALEQSGAWPMRRDLRAGEVAHMSPRVPVAQLLARPTRELWPPGAWPRVRQAILDLPPYDLDALSARIEVEHARAVRGLAPPGRSPDGPSRLPVGERCGLTAGPHQQGCHVPPPPPPRPRLQLDDDVLSLDGKPVDLDLTAEGRENALTLLRKLLSQPFGAWVSGPDIGADIRWDRVCRSLPPSVQRLIDRRTGRGYRLRPEAWHR